MWSSCNLINPAEDIPAYIYVDSLTFSADGQEGTSSEKITEVWVVAEGEIIGAYQIPAYIPILSSGAKEISFFAGIKNNGIAATRMMYPFYEPDTQSLMLVEGDTIQATPHFEYKTSLEFITEDFESGTQLGETSSSQVNMSVIDNSNDPDDVFEGEHSGYVAIPEEFNVWEARWANEMFLPAGERIWLEMDYKCNNTFAVGLYAVSGGGDIKSLSLIVNPTTDDAGVPQWNKIYVELTQTASQYLSADFFNLYLESARQDDVNTAEVWVDNLKIVHFE